MKITKSIYKLSVALVIVLSSCDDSFDQAESPTGSTITQVASGNSDLNILTAALTKTGLANSFNNNNSGSFTVFAPTDAAFISYFQAVGNATAFPDEAAIVNYINALTSTATTAPTLTALTNVLTYHAITSRIPSSQVANAQGFATLNGARLSLSKVLGAVVLNANRAGQNAASNGGQSVTLDITASNGVIHTIDKVLIPVAQANIWTSPFMIFTVNYAVSPAAVSISGAVMPRNADGSINVSSAATNAIDTDYNLLTMAVVRANLATTFITVSTPLPDYTVFAPTDGAFRTYLGVATETAARDAINSLAPNALADILKYHVVSGRVLSTDLTSGQPVTTLYTGKTFAVNLGTTNTIADGRGNTATITSVNNLTNAGVIHQISRVLVSN